MSSNEKIEKYFKKSGLKYYETDSGDWELIILDPRLNNQVVKQVIPMIGENKNYVQIKDKVGRWFTRQHLATIRRMIQLYKDDEFSYWRNTLTNLTKRMRWMESNM